MGEIKTYGPEDFINYRNLVRSRFTPDMEKIIRTQFLIPGVSPTETLNTVLCPRNNAQLEFCKNFWETLDLVLENESFFTTERPFNFKVSKIFGYIYRFFDITIDNFNKVINTNISDEQRFQDLQDDLAKKEIELLSDYVFNDDEKEFYRLCSELTFVMSYYQGEFKESLKNRFGGNIFADTSMFARLTGSPEEIDGLSLTYIFSVDTLLSSRITIDESKDDEKQYKDAIDYFNVLADYIHSFHKVRDHE